MRVPRQGFGRAALGAVAILVGALVVSGAGASGWRKEENRMGASVPAASSLGRFAHQDSGNSATALQERAPAAATVPNLAVASTNPEKIRIQPELDADPGDGRVRIELDKGAVGRTDVEAREVENEILKHKQQIEELKRRPEPDP